MTPEEVKIWEYLVKNPLASALAVTMALDVPVALAQACIDRIGTPRDVLQAKAAYDRSVGETYILPDPEADPLRVQLLKEAARITGGGGERAVNYGSAYDTHLRAATIFNLHTGMSLKASDVARVMIAVKQARRMHSPLHRDSYVDDMAYTGILYECLLEELGY